MGYYLNPTELTAMFAVPISVSDKHLKLASAEALKVLLWCLKNSEKQYNITAVGEALKLNEYAVRDALDFWCERGVLCSTSEIPVAKEPAKKPKAVRSAVVKPGRDEVARRGLEAPEIAFILRETEQKFGRTLRQNELSTLVWLHDDLGMSASLIMMIVSFAVTEGRANIGFIERTAIDWVNDGVEDIESAEQHLVVMRRSRSAWATVENALGIEHRQPSPAELKMADTWINDWNYSFDIIREAYNVCVNTTSKFSIPYIKKVVSEWHKAGIKTVDDINKLNAKNQPTVKTDNQSDYTDFVNGIIFTNEEDS